MLDVHVQWAKTVPEDYITVPVGEWDALPKKASDSVLDGEPGLIAHIVVMGQPMGEDHVSVELLPDGKIRMCGWSADALEGGLPIGKEWIIGDNIVTSTRVYSPRLGVRITEELRGPYTTKTVYCEESLWPNEPHYTNPGQVVFKPYADFVPPPDAATRHGILMPDALWKEHNAFDHPDDVPA